MRHILIIISILLLSSPLFGQSDEPTNLYRWEVDEKVYVWKIFGDEDLNPKYRGEVKEGKPDGLGITTFPDGSKYVGSYKNGKRHGRGTWFTKISGEIKPFSKGEYRDGYYWNILTYNFDGTVRNKYVNGFLTNGVLYTRKVNDVWVWDSTGDEKKDGKYVGGIENWKPNGKGSVTYTDGSKYVGEYRDGIKHGQGTYSYPDGNKLDGIWKNGLFNGKGTYKFINGDKYVGEYKNGKYHGQGTWTWTFGKYVGEFKDGLKNGQGKLNYSDGKIYKGEWKNGSRYGQGSLTFPDGSEYIGEWKNGREHGQGTWTWYDGNKYEGEWKVGEPNGQGTYSYPDGRKSIGEYRDDKPWNVIDYDKNGSTVGKWVNGLNKYGVISYGDGEYFGEIENRKPNGQGTFSFPSGSKKVGEWKEGKLNGQGTYSYPDGGKSVGEYRKDYQWNVIDYDKNGLTVGKWVNGSLKFGVIWTNDGEYFGEIENGEQNGHGTLTYPDGRKFVGEFKNGEYWNITGYDKNGNIFYKYVNGKGIKQ